MKKAADCTAAIFRKGERKKKKYMKSFSAGPPRKEK